MRTSGLRFCMVTTFYPPHNFGGDGIAVQRLARALVRRGHQVTVLHDADAYEALGGRAGCAADGERDGVEVVALRSRLGRLSPFLTQQLGRPIVNGRAIRRLLEEGAFDVIHFHNVSLLGGPGILSFGRALKLYTAHEHWLVCPTHVLWRHRREVCTGRECLRCVLRYRRPPQVWRWTGYLERQLGNVDAFIAMSEFSRWKHREFGFPHDMEVIPPFLPAEDGGPESRTPPAHSRPYFLFVGRLERMKGLDEVIPLFRRDSTADLLVVGDGDHGPVLRRLAAGVPGVHFLRSVPPSRLRAYYRHALALIVPSVGYETFGMVLIEAFREGTPVLARRIGPFPEIVNACGGGELFDDGEELLGAMRRIRERPGHREALGRAAHLGFLRHWSEEAVLPRYLDLVRRTAEAKGRRALAGALAGEVAV